MNRHWRVLLLLLPTWGFSMDRTPPPDAAERALVYPGGTHVLIIGISEYASDAWPPLHARRDVERMQALFIDRGVAASAITVATPAAGDKQSIDEILVRFGEALPADAGENSRVVVYVAGHGYTRDGVGYLVSPAAPDPEVHPAEFKLASLPITTLLTRVASFRVPHVLLILDSCFSGLALQSLPRERFPHPLADHAHVLQVVTAGTAGQTVADDGRFSQLVVSGLLGAADLNVDGWVSGTELGMYLRLRMSEMTGGRQTPTFGNIVWGSEFSAGENWFASAQLLSLEKPVGEGKSQNAAFRDCDECPPMRIVPAPAGGAGSPPPSLPYLAMASHETTFEEYDACFRAGGCTHWARSGSAARGALPVVDVSRQDAEQYVRWLTCVTTGPYRLPRDQEWLAAAQPDVARLAGAAPAPANCRDCAKGTPSDGPTPAGSFAANEYGLFDLVGNVWEWVADCAPAHPDCQQGSVRGGAFSTAREAASRLPTGELPATARDRNIGFRVVRELSGRRPASGASCAAEVSGSR